MHEKVFTYLKPFIYRTFDIREGEFKKARLMMFQIFLIISSLLVVKPAVNALFLDHFGARQLPMAFVVVSIMAAIGSLFYSKMLIKRSLHKVSQGTLWIAMLSFALFAILLKANILTGVVLYVFYIWISIFGVLAASQFWILANLIFNPREAKRLFGFIGAGAIAGGIFGGYLATLIASTLGSEYVILGGSFLLIGAILVNRRIHFHLVQGKTGNTSELIQVATKIENPIRLIKNSRHLTYLALIIAVGVIVAKLVEYQYSAIASARIPDPDKLTAFFGVWFSTINLVSLIIQLFLTRKVVGVFGVGLSLLFLPLAIIFGTFAVLFFPELWAAVVVKMADGTLKQSVNKSAIELLALPIPAEIKKQTKSFIDVFVDSAATGVGGIILLFLIIGLNLPVQFVSVIIILLIIVWIYLVKKVRVEYLEQFKKKLGEFKGHQAELLEGLDKQSILESLKAVLLGGNVAQILFILKSVSEIRDERLVEAIYDLLAHESDEVRVQALKSLYFLYSVDYCENIRKLTSDPNESVRIAAFEYLVEHLKDNRLDEIKAFLNHEDIKIRDSALMALAKETKGNIELQEQLGILDFVRKKKVKIDIAADEKERKRISKLILRIVGLGRIPLFYSFIHQHLSVAEKDLVLVSIESAGFTQDEQFIQPLLDVVDEPYFMQAASVALGGYGVEIFNHLPQNAEDFVHWAKLGPFLPKVIAQVDSQKSADYLVNVIIWDRSDMENTAIESLAKLLHRYRHLSVSKKKLRLLLHREVRDFEDQVNNYLEENKDFIDSKQVQSEPLIRQKEIQRILYRVCRILSFVYDEDIMNQVYESLVSGDESDSINATELLDNYLEAMVKPLVIPMIELTIAESISKADLRKLHPVSEVVLPRRARRKSKNAVIV